MYTLFLLKSKSSWRNLGFTVENVVENMVIQVLCVWNEYFPLVFDDIFDSKYKISPGRLAFQKKKCIHGKCGRASRVQIYFGKSLENEVFLARIHKNHPKTMQIIYCVVS